jgi:CRP-like cAMP-binding protein
LIDRIRRDIEERIEQLHAEAEKLGRALAALDPREKPAARRAARPAAKPATKAGPEAAATPAPKPAAKRTRKSASSPAQAAANGRTARGATKAKVLGTLSSDGAMTAGDVAKAAGLDRATVSTTLSKLAKAGEIAKAERGYRLPAAS